MGRKGLERSGGGWSGICCAGRMCLDGKGTDEGVQPKLKQGPNQPLPSIPQGLPSSNDSPDGPWGMGLLVVLIKG